MKARGIAWSIGPLLAGLLCGGCIPASPTPPFKDPPEALTPRDPLTHPGGGSDVSEVCGGASGRFFGALTYTGTEATVQNRIESPNQSDIYELGNLTEGTTLRIAVNVTSGDLDPEVAVFDADANLVGINDDADFDAGVLDSLLEFPIYSSGLYYVVVEASRFFAPAPCPTTGDYVMNVTATAGPPPAPRAQVVFLDFDGSDIPDIPGISKQTIQPFDALDLGLPSSQTQQIKADVVDLIKQDYAGLNVTFITSDQPAPSPPFTTVIFGGGQQGLLGLADEVDSFNRDLDNTVVIFTNNFNGISRDAHEVAQAIANVASHELGHALGLFHVENDRLLMDRVTPNPLLVLDQSFGRGALSEFLVGFQDAGLLLAWWLGVL